MRANRLGTVQAEYLSSDPPLKTSHRNRKLTTKMKISVIRLTKGNSTSSAQKTIESMEIFGMRVIWDILCRCLQEEQRVLDWFKFCAFSTIRMQINSSLSNHWKIAEDVEMKHCGFMCKRFIVI